MKAGDALYKFFTDVLGIKADDPDLKEFISDPELAKQELTSVAQFNEHFLTFEQAKKNKAIISEIEAEAKRTAFGEYTGAAEGALRKWARDNGITADAMNQIFKDNPQQDKRLAAVLKLVDENARKASGQTAEEWKAEKEKLYNETRDLKQKLDEETTRITGEFTQKLTAKEKEMVKMHMIAALPGVMKFRSNIPGLTDLQGLKLQALLDKYHIVKHTDGSFKFYDPADTSKEVFDDKGKALSFNKLVGELFPIAEYGETGNGGNGGNGNGKTIVVDPKTNTEVPQEVADKIALNDKMRPSKQPAQ